MVVRALIIAKSWREMDLSARLRGQNAENHFLGGHYEMEAETEKEFSLLGNKAHAGGK